MYVKLYIHQIDAVKRMKNGCILCGGVGSGKSRTSLAYYFKEMGGDLNKDISYMKNPKDLYIITTARKRDTFEWQSEMTPFLLHTEQNANYYKNKVVVDSWNNISKYKDVTNAFFIFDEQRVVGYGAWSKSFIRIARRNQWILLSATPGDTWMDYIPVFIANGFYRNKSDFIQQHVVYSRYSKFPKVDRYINTSKLVRLRDDLLINMDFERHTVQHHEDVWVDYDKDKYKAIIKDRWNPSTNEPIVNAAELCYEMRKVVNSHRNRGETILDIVRDKKRVIIFYNYDYELDILKNLYYETADGKACDVAEWNGHKHEPIPRSDSWVYLVQYTAGAEGWNCTETDTIIFYSQNYSYKIMVQSSGRIDRLNTPYTDLYFYHLKSRAPIDLAIARALKGKQKFNESAFISRRLI